jgi:hypothetical protein
VFASELIVICGPPSSLEKLSPTVESPDGSGFATNRAIAGFSSTLAAKRCSLASYASGSMRRAAGGRLTPESISGSNLDFISGNLGPAQPPGKCKQRYKARRWRDVASYVSTAVEALLATSWSRTRTGFPASTSKDKIPKRTCGDQNDNHFASQAKTVLSSRYPSVDFTPRGVRTRSR